MPTHDDETPDGSFSGSVSVDTREDDREVGTSEADLDDADGVLIVTRKRRRRRLSRWARFKRWCGRHKALVTLLTILLLLIAILLAWLFYLNRQLGNIDRFPLNLDREGRPAKVDNGSVNILLLGLDDPDYLPDVGPDMHDLVEGTWQRGAFRSDTMMVLHLNSDRKSAQLVSIPRDSWVEIPGHGQNKINAALSFGGPTLAAQTVEDAFDLHIDHVVLLDFQGFRDLTEVLDGVDVYISQTASEQLSDGEWPEGMRELRGNDALRYVQQRYGLPRGDFDRVQRQQAFLKAVLDKVVSRGTLLNPLRLTNLVEELSDLVAVDEGFTNRKMLDLAMDSRGLHSRAMRFVTVPNLGSDMEGRASIVRLDEEKAIDMFAAIQKDQFESWYAHNEIDEMAPGGRVS